MKKIFLLTVILATMLTMFGCAPAATPAPAATQAPAAKAKTYADMTLCYPQLGAESDWRTANTASFKETAVTLGIKKLVFSDAQQKQENQISAVRSCIQQAVDVIALPPSLKMVGMLFCKKPKMPRFRSSSSTVRSRPPRRCMLLTSARTWNWKAKKKYAGQIQGVFIHNDDMAIGAIEAIKAAGLNPGDLKIISIDWHSKLDPPQERLRQLPNRGKNGVFFVIFAVSQIPQK